MTETPIVTTVFGDDGLTKRRLQKGRLVVFEGAQAGDQLLVDRERITVGRSGICDLVLTDPAVSGSHFEIVTSEDGCRVRDLESTNGTFVGDVRILEAYLKPGAVVRCGQTRLRFEAADGTVDIEVAEEERFGELLGRSVRMRSIFAALRKVATTDLTVLIRGETGTGKELVARALHRASKRAEGPFVVQDCGAIPRNLVESTLFGHERGAFTGATDRHRGSFEMAEGGTLFLDEVGELDLSLQPKLLRVLENRDIRRVGGERALPVDVRVIAATNRDLRQMVSESTFREDLYYRVGIVQVEMPPLRERPEDIPLLVDAFLDEAASLKWPGEERELRVTPDAMARLSSYHWPGNVRELKNTVERAALLADGDELGVADLMPPSQKTPAVPLPGGTAEQFVAEELPFKEAKQRVLDAFEVNYLKALLDKHDGNITRSAKEAGLTRYHLRELAKRYGIRDV
ncbi:MAG: sigma 54-interacting transcriptional regulator [Myxococcota bacterium]